MSRQRIQLLNIDRRASLISRLASIAVFVGCLAVLGQFVSALTATTIEVAWPYVWFDVAVVQLLCALPLAVIIARWLVQRLPAAACLVLAALLLGVTIPLGVDRLHFLLVRMMIQSPLMSMAMRTLVSICLAVEAALAWHVLWRPGRLGGSPPGWSGSAAITGVATALWLFVPATYVGARCRHDLDKLTEYSSRSRILESRRLVWGLTALDASQQWYEQPIVRVALHLDESVAWLESQVAAPLGSQATIDQRLSHARHLAMLDRTNAALAILDAIDDPAADAEVEGLRGTIQAEQGAWETALVTYGRARAAWETRASGEPRLAGLAAAIRGIAYCHRKSGRYAEAEVAYLQLLAVAPTADAHFLVAQFYEDAQQSTAAQRHAARAMELAPDRYTQPAQELIRKLSVYQFGCLGVYQAHGDR